VEEMIDQRGIEYSVELKTIIVGVETSIPWKSENHNSHRGKTSSTFYGATVLTIGIIESQHAET
jgi:hypothetical protein